MSDSERIDRGVDFGKTVADYGKWRAGCPEALFTRLQALSLGAAGQRVLDLGTGTGSVALGFAQRGAIVSAIDRSAEMIAEVSARAAAMALAVDARVARAEDTGFADSSFDLVIAGQCWHWFDRPAAAREAGRVLAPGGALVITHFDWVELPGNVVEATEQLIAEANPNQPAPHHKFAKEGLYGTWLRDAAVAGFHTLETFSFDVDVPYLPDAWRGRIRASAAIGASLPPAAVEAFDARLAQALQTRFPTDHLTVPHRVFALIART